jgi:hypothetical protein
VPIICCVPCWLVVKTVIWFPIFTEIQAEERVIRQVSYLRYFKGEGEVKNVSLIILTFCRENMNRRIQAYPQDLNKDDAV